MATDRTTNEGRIGINVGPSALIVTSIAAGAPPTDVPDPLEAPPEGGARRASSCDVTGRGSGTTPGAGFLAAPAAAPALLSAFGGTPPRSAVLVAGAEGGAAPGCEARVLWGALAAAAAVAVIPETRVAPAPEVAAATLGWATDTACRFPCRWSGGVLCSEAVSGELITGVWARPPPPPAPSCTPCTPCTAAAGCGLVSPDNALVVSPAVCPAAQVTAEGPVRHRLRACVAWLKDKCHSTFRPTTPETLEGAVVENV